MAYNPKSLENLLPWKPGQNGNPNGHGPGRPPGSVNLTTLLKRRLAQNEICRTRTPDGRSNAEWFVDQLIVEAMRGNGAAIREIFDRNDGRIPAPAETPPVTMETLASMEEASARVDGEAQADPEQVQE